MSLIVIGCGTGESSSEFAYEFDIEYGDIRNIEEFFEEFSLKFLQMYPERASSIGIFEGYEDIRQDHKLNDISFEFREKIIHFYKNSLDLLQSFDEGSMTTQQKINKDHLQWYLSVKIEEADYIRHDYLVNHFVGVAISIPSFMERYHEVNSLEDAENYIKRLESIPWQLEQLEEGILEQKELGIIPPKFIVEQFRMSLSRLIRIKVEEHSLYTTFVSKLEDATGITGEQKERLKGEVLEIVEDTVYPAYSQLIDNTSDLSEGSVSSGVWELPQGEEYYAYLVKWHTTTDLTPKDVHDLGLREVERIQGEIRQILDENGYEDVDAIRAMGQIRNRGLVTGRDRILEEYREIVEKIESVMPELFNTIPTTPVFVEPVPSYRETTFANHYVQPSRDGNRPGVFYLNLAYHHSRPDMEALAFHEALPGHHTQRAIQIEAGHPLFRDSTSFTAYSEGWALYAEKLMYEMGYYSDPFSELGYLQSELFRAARLVVDTGIHYKKWTKAEAMEYMQEITGNTYENEINRYIVWPGQALAYKIGELKILELRDLAMEELGENFDLKEFHDIVLIPGAVPLEVLEQEVLRYIQDK